MIDLRRLQVLRVLQHEGSVTGVARALHLTPSAVSQQIRLLGRDLGLDLLQRHGRNVRVTAAAEALIAYADEVYAGWERTLADARTADASGPAERLRLCGFATAVASLLAPAAMHLQSRRPGIALEITEAETPECYARLLADDTDLAVVVPTGDGAAVDASRLEQHRLLDDPFDLLVPAGHPLAGQDEADLAEAAAEPWIAAPDTLDQHRLMRAAWLAAGFAPRVAHQAQEWNAMVSLVSHGFGVCMVPRLAPLPAHQAVVRVPLRGEPVPFRRVFTVVRRGSGEQQHIAAACAAVEEVSAGLPPLLLDEHPAPDHEPAVPHRHRQRG